MLDLLDGVGSGRISQDEIAETSTKLVSTLTALGVPVRLSEVREGPTVTLYGLRLSQVDAIKQVAVLDSAGNNTYNDKGHIVTRRDVVSKSVTVNQLKARLPDLRVALGTTDIRLEIPIEGTDLVGIEVPNGKVAHIPLKYVMDNAVRLGPLAVGLGEAASGEAVAIDLAKMPHLLVAGATGSGKSVCINTLLTSLLVTRTPDDLWLMLIDPKRVELAPYEGIPHLMAPVVTDVDDADEMLSAVIGQMSQRYELLQGAGVRNITTYNDKADERLPYIVVVIDELADLMMTSGKYVEQALCRLAQMGRATGIHLVVATQRPSVDVITGLIKANFPSRISFAVASNTDSRTVLDASGAELLLGRGDMLYQAVDMPRPQRIQGCFVSDAEVVRVTDHWRNSGHEPVAIHTAVADNWGYDDDDYTNPHLPLSSRAIMMLRDYAEDEDDYTSYAWNVVSELALVLGIDTAEAVQLADDLSDLGVLSPTDGTHHTINTAATAALDGGDDGSSAST